MTTPEMTTPKKTIAKKASELSREDLEKYYVSEHMRAERATKRAAAANNENTTLRQEINKVKWESKFKQARLDSGESSWNELQRLRNQIRLIHDVIGLSAIPAYNKVEDWNKGTK